MPDHEVSQVAPLVTTSDCTATVQQRCSTHQYYWGEETKHNLCFIPKFLCIDGTRVAKSAQTCDSSDGEVSNLIDFFIHKRWDEAKSSYNHIQLYNSVIIIYRLQS